MSALRSSSIEGSGVSHDMALCGSFSVGSGCSTHSSSHLPCCWRSSMRTFIIRRATSRRSLRTASGSVWRKALRARWLWARMSRRSSIVWYWVALTKNACASPRLTSSTNADRKAARPSSRRPCSLRHVQVKVRRQDAWYRAGCRRGRRQHAREPRGGSEESVGTTCGGAGRVETGDTCRPAGRSNGTHLSCMHDKMWFGGMSSRVMLVSIECKSSLSLMVSSQIWLGQPRMSDDRPDGEGLTREIPYRADRRPWD